MPRDLPTAWAEGMKQLLGITPPDNIQGCLQDIHWYCGLWGYFPTYTIGAMVAAQLFEAAKSADKYIVPALATGNFEPLNSWLRHNVHQLGARYTTNEILRRVTGSPLNSRAFKNHIKARYLD